MFRLEIWIRIGAEFPFKNECLTKLQFQGIRETCFFELHDKCTGG
jgi:hypothetical protein